MAHLDWKAKQSSEILLHREPHSEREHLLKVRLDAAHQAHWEKELSALLRDENPNAELKSEWPGGWTIYWKNRDEESRVLLAHPEEHLWVATVAWGRGHADVLIGAMARLTADGTPFSLFDFEGISHLSNLEICFERLQG